MEEGGGKEEELRRRGDSPDEEEGAVQGCGSRRHARRATGGAGVGRQVRGEGSDAEATKEI